MAEVPEDLDKSNLCMMLLMTRFSKNWREINLFDMNNLYKITVEPVTAFCSPLQSDTFFGAFCWSYLFRYGEKALQELIFHAKSRNPDIIFSNAFPSGCLPMPIGISRAGEKQSNSTKQERYQAYIEEKKQEHLSKITLDDFNRIINGMPGAFSDDVDTEIKIMSWRNMVSRESGTVENVEGESHLFEVEEIYSKGNFDIYIYSTLEKEVLNCTLKEMFRSGIGAQRSVGKGAFKISDELILFDGFKIPEKQNAFVALSNFIPGKEDPTEGYYEAFVKYPKVSQISSEGDSPFKKPLIFLKAGSVFYDQPVNDFYGSCMERIAIKSGVVSNEIVIGAYTIAIPCYVND